MPIPPTGTSPAPPDPNAATKAETDRLRAEAELEKARAERVKALGLPAFEGKTTLNQGGGAIEALILATDAIDAAAREIAESAERVSSPSNVFLILAGDEQVDFGIAAAIRAETKAFARIFDAFGPPGSLPIGAVAESVAGPIAAISAIAGLLRTETQITAVDLSAISHRVLATAVAGRLIGKAILPGAATTTLAPGPLAEEVMGLAARRDRLIAAAPKLPAEAAESLKASLARFDSFFARITSPDATGRVLLAQAARLEQLLSDMPLMLRIFVEKAGGSLINRTNLWTFFGRDPVRVSGGLVASFTITDPTTGRVLAAEVLNCRTRLASLKRIQSGQPVRGAGNSTRITGRDGGHAATASRRAKIAASDRETNMATLRIEATPSANLRQYRLQLDDNPTNLPMHDNACSVDVEGTCGDGSLHYLHYVLVGPVGAKIDLKIWCDDILKIDVPVEIYAAGPTYNGDVEFRL